MKILEDIQLFFEHHSGNGPLYTVLTERLRKTRAMLGAGYWLPCLDLPAVLARGFGLSLQQGRQLAQINASVYLGADLLDDLHDRDLSGVSDNVSVADLTLLAAFLSTVFPMLMISDLSAAADTRLVMQKTLAQFLLKMGEGQRQDLALAHRNAVSIRDVKHSIQGKSGEELALGVVLTAQLAKRSGADGRLCEELGHSLGMALQLASDLHDLFWDSEARDLRRGARSLPIAFCLEKLEGERREELLALLEEVASNPEKVASVREILIDSGSLDYLALLVEDLCLRSLAIVDVLELQDEAGAQLRTRIRSVSVLSPTYNPIQEEIAYAASS